MGQTLTNGIYLPNEGERNCYSGLAANWNAVDTLKGNYSLHAINVDIHVTAAEKETWNGKADASALTAHTGDTTIHVTAEDKQAWNGHVADSVKHVTAADKAKWDAVTSKANDSDVVHKSGNEVISGEKNFKNTSTDYSGIKLEGTRVCYITADNANDGVFPANACSSSLLLPDGNKSIHVGRWTSSNNRIFLNKSYPYMSFNGSILRGNTYVPTGETGTATLRLMAQLNFADDTNKNVDVRLTQYDSTFSALYPNTDNVTSLGVATKKWSDVRTYKVNGVEPSSLSLPSDRSARIDISSYFTNTGTGDTNTYTVPANGYINLTLSELTNVHCFSSTSNNLVNYCQTFTKASNSTGALYILFPVRKNDVFVATWYTTTTVSVDGAFFIPCRGNI